MEYSEYKLLSKDSKRSIIEQYVKFPKRCPNCHSLTPTHGSLNNGKGRAWRLANNK
jgi:hypothetical protein